MFNNSIFSPSLFLESFFFNFPFFSRKLLLTSVQRLGGSLQRNHNLSLHACFGFCPPLQTLAPPGPPSADTRQGLNWAGGSGGYMWQ